MAISKEERNRRTAVRRQASKQFPLDEALREDAELRDRGWLPMVEAAHTYGAKTTEHLRRLIRTHEFYTVETIMARGVGGRCVLGSRSERSDGVRWAITTPREWVRIPPFCTPPPLKSPLSEEVLQRVIDAGFSDGDSCRNYIQGLLLELGIHPFFYWASRCKILHVLYARAMLSAILSARGLTTYSIAPLQGLDPTSIIAHLRNTLETLPDNFIEVFERETDRRITRDSLPASLNDYKTPASVLRALSLGMRHWPDAHRHVVLDYLSCRYMGQRHLPGRCRCREGLALTRGTYRWPLRRLLRIHGGEQYVWLLDRDMGMERAS